MIRTIDDIYGNPVKIEIDNEPTPDALGTLDEMIQALLLAREILRGEITPQWVLPPYKPYPRKKEGKR